MDSNMDLVGAHLLGKLEQNVGPVFFPFPGAVKINLSKRETFQRELIQESEAELLSNLNYPTKTLALVK